MLAQILLVRIMQARRPFEGLAPATLVVIAALGLYTLMTLLSASWSHSSGRALIEFDRAWLYLLILVLFGSVRASTRDLRWLIRGLVIGASVVCLAGLISRVLPDVWHTAPNVSNQRLSYPVTYWNALGLLAALGFVLAFHLTCSLGERRLARILAAAVVPLLAATLFFTFSRGAMAAGAVGLVVYMLVARPRGLLSGALATVPATVVLIVVAYHANLLDTVEPTTPAAVSQGHRVALAAGICAAVSAGLRAILAVGLDPLLRRFAGRPLIEPHDARLAAIAGAVAAVLVVVLALGVPHSLEHDWHRFISGAAPSGEHDRPARAPDRSVQRRAHRPVAGRAARVLRLAAPRLRGGDVPDPVGPQSSLLRLYGQRPQPLLPGDGRVRDPGHRAARDRDRRCRSSGWARAPAGRGARSTVRCSRPASSGRCTPAWTGTGRCPSSRSGSSPSRARPSAPAGVPGPAGSRATTAA